MIDIPTTYSKAFLSHKIDCTPEGRKNCGGKCCLNKTIEANGRYLITETDKINKLPLEIKKQLVPKNNEYLIPTTENGCIMVDICFKDPSIKPLQCNLFPFKVRNGNLMLYRWVWLFCPNVNKGDPIWISLKDNLVQIFGQECYDNITKVMNEPIHKKVYKNIEEAF